MATTAAGVLCGALAVELVGRVGIDLSALTSQDRFFTVSGVICLRHRPRARHPAGRRAHRQPGFGQRLEDLAAQVDILAPMLYPSGFQNGVGEVKNPVAQPYEVIARSLCRAQERSGLPAHRFRPWLQAFRDYAFDRRRFTGQEISAQVAASDVFGANGWMLWNAANVYGSLAELLPSRLTAVAVPLRAPDAPAANAS